MTIIGRSDGTTATAEPFTMRAQRRRDARIAALCRRKTGSAPATVALLSGRFNHISFELSAKFGFPAAPDAAERGAALPEGDACLSK
jgi:hypothetical protein